MQKQKIKFNFAQVVQMTAGEHEVIIDNGVMYVALCSGLVGVTAATTPEVAAAVAPAVQKPAASKPAPTVVDDTKPAAKKAAPAKPAAKPAPKPAPVVEEEEEAEEEVDDNDPRAGHELIDTPEEVEIGTNVMVYMASEGMNHQLWAATVVDGTDFDNNEEGRIWVQFHEDDEVDYLRFEDGDELYAFSIGTQF